MTHCVILNADYSFLNVVDWKRAVCLMVKNKVEVLSYSDQVIGGAEGFTLKVPLVMKLIKLIRAIYRAKVHFNKKNVLIRDGFACAYCGAKNTDLTLDHIISKSRGGKSNFENCVACCITCNHRKGNRTPSEVNMRLLFRPHQPTISEFFKIRLRRLGIDSLLEELGVY